MGVSKLHSCAALTNDQSRKNASGLLAFIFFRLSLSVVAEILRIESIQWSSRDQFGVQRRRSPGLKRVTATKLNMCRKCAACVQAPLWICDDREPGPRLAEIRIKSGYPTGKTYINGTIGVPVEYIPAPSALIRVQRRDRANV
jgi:hypothetical protein